MAVLGAQEECLKTAVSSPRSVLWIQIGTVVEENAVVESQGIQDKGETMSEGSKGT